jgi:hypothetical protein
VDDPEIDPWIKFQGDFGRERYGKQRSWPIRFLRTVDEMPTASRYAVLRKAIGSMLAEALLQGLFISVFI